MVQLRATPIALTALAVLVLLPNAQSATLATCTGTAPAQTSCLLGTGPSAGYLDFIYSGRFSAAPTTATISFIEDWGLYSFSYRLDVDGGREVGLRTCDSFAGVDRCSPCIEEDGFTYCNEPLPSLFGLAPRPPQAKTYTCTSSALGTSTPGGNGYWGCTTIIN